MSDIDPKILAFAKIESQTECAVRKIIAVHHALAAAAMILLGAIYSYGVALFGNGWATTGINREASTLIPLVPLSVISFGLALRVAVWFSIGFSIVSGLILVLAATDLWLHKPPAMWMSTAIYTVYTSLMVIAAIFLKEYIPWTVSSFFAGVYCFAAIWPLLRMRRLSSDV